MLLPFFGNKSRHSLYTLLINKSVVAACAWHVEKDKSVVDALSQLVEWNEDDPTTLFEAADTAIASLNIQANQVLLSLPDDWVQGQGIHPKKKPLLKALTEKLELSSVGFVVTVEAVIAHLKESATEPVNTVCMAVESDAVIVSIISQGSPSALVRVGRSGNAQEDFLEACSRLKIQGIPPEMRIFPLSETDAVLAEMKQEIEMAIWDPGLFIQLPAVVVENYAFVLSAVTQSGGREVIKALPELHTERTEQNSTPVAPFDFAPIKENVVSQSTPDMPAESPQTEATFYSADETNTGVRSKMPLLFGVGAVSIIGILFLCIQLLSPKFVRATVTITRKSQKIDTTAMVTFDAHSNASESATLVRATVVPISVNGEKEVPTTGKKETGEKAKGTVTLFNKTLQSKKFPAGTILKTGKLTFTLDSDVTAASASANISETVNGKASAKATASAFGESGNIDKNVQLTIGTFDNSAYIAQTEEPFSGGLSKTVSAVASKDQQSAIDELTPTLKAQAKTKFEESVTEGQEGILLEDIEIVNKKWNKAVGEEAESVSVSLTASASALVYAKADVMSAVRPQLETSLPSGVILRSDALHLTPGEQRKVSSTRIEQQFTVSGDVIPPIDATQYASILAGKNLEESRDFLENQQTVASYTITYTPQFLSLFVKRLPADPAKITINLQQ